MQKKPVGPRITPNAREFYEKTWGGVNKGCQFALEFFPFIYRRTLSEMAGQFTQDEKNAIASLCEGNDILISRRPGRWLLHIVETAIYNGTCPVRSSSSLGLLRKLQALSGWPLDCVAIWGARCGIFDEKQPDKFFDELRGYDEPPRIKPDTSHRDMSSKDHAAPR